MSDLRSSHQQLKDELDQMYLELTDPEQIEKRRLVLQREQLVAEKESDTGL